MPALSRRDTLLGQRVERFTRMLRGLKRLDARAVHGTRVASRRLRELLPVLALGGSDAEKLGRRLRKVTQRLGPVRELDVLLLLIAELHTSGRFDTAALARVAQALSVERTEAHARLGARVPLATWRRLAAKLGRLVDQIEDAPRRRPGARGWRWAIEARIGRRAAALRAALGEAGAVYLPDRLHAARIALKKLRYALELRAETGDDTLDTELKILKRNQDLLGRLRDRQLLIDRVRRVQASLSPPDVTVWRGLNALIAALEQDCRRLHARYLRDVVALGAVCDRVGMRARATAAAATSVPGLRRHAGSG